MYSIFRPLLFRLDPERSHQLTLRLLSMAGNVSLSNWFLSQLYKTKSKPVQVFGLTFKNPVGLAAGYEKDGLAIRGLSALGFGHIEIGTVTPEPQAGNPSPRVFRLVEDEAVINRMGFPSKGADFVVGKLKRSNVRTFKHADVVFVVNLGKNKDTPLEESADDYIKLMKVFAPLADYLTINISSPNTVGLRRLQGREMLDRLLDAAAHERRVFSLTPNSSPAGRGGFTPILVKISPDMNEEELDDAVGVILDKNMDGIIATNTTLAREGLRSTNSGESGGLSGSPLKVRSEAVLSRVVKLVNGRIPIVSVCGIMNPDDVKKRLALGASLVQVYTGLVYHGPGLVKQIVKSL